MNWYQQTTNMMQMWADTQQKMLSQWMTPPTKATTDDQPAQAASANSSGMNSMWFDVMRNSMEQMNAQMEPTAQAVMQNLFASQMTTMQLMELSMKTWQTMLPAVQAGTSWQPLLDQQMALLRGQMQQWMGGGVQSMTNMQQLWAKYWEEAGHFTAPWFKSMQDSVPYYERFMQGDMAALIEMTSLYNDAFQDSLGNMLQMPGLGYTREMDAKVRRNFITWVEMQQAGYEYQIVVVDAWLKAFERLMHELAELAAKGESLDSVRDFLNRWSNLADETFKTTFHSEQYVALQGKYINAMMEFRNEQRQLNEMFMEYYDLPTRSEIDETHRRVYELRKEVRALRREIAELKAADKPRPKRKSTRKTSTKKDDK